MEFKEKIKQLRKENKMSQYELADKLNISRSVIAKWETGVSFPNKEMLKQISEYFDILEEDLLDIKEANEVIVEKNKKLKNRMSLAIILSSIIVVMVFTLISITYYSFYITPNNIYKKVKKLCENGHLEYAEIMYEELLEHDFYVDNFMPKDIVLYFDETERKPYLEIKNGVLTLNKELLDTEELIIPYFFNSEKVVKISGFNDCSKIKKIIIPVGVEEIDTECFKNCENLEEINVPDSVEKIGSFAFSGCKSLKHITIPNGVIELKNNVFNNCENLEKITLMEGITSIGNNVFENCVKLKEIILPKTIGYIGSNAFNNCKSLINIVIPDKVTSIESGTFQKCQKLKNINLPKKLEDIAAYAFEGCDNLEEITLPDSVTSLGKGVFQKCIKLSKILMSSNIKIIPQYAFYGCQQLRDVVFLDNIVEFQAYCFYECKNLNNITFPNTLQYIKEYAFYGCSQFTMINIPKSTKSVERYAFGNCPRVNVFSISDISILNSLAVHNSYELLNCIYKQGIEYLGYKDYLEAYLRFNYLGDYRDSPKQMQKVLEAAVEEYVFNNEIYEFIILMRFMGNPDLNILSKEVADKYLKAVMSYYEPSWSNYQCSVGAYYDRIKAMMQLIEEIQEISIAAKQMVDFNNALKRYYDEENYIFFLNELETLQKVWGLDFVKQFCLNNWMIEDFMLGKWKTMDEKYYFNFYYNGVLRIEDTNLPKANNIYSSYSYGIDDQVYCINVGLTIKEKLYKFNFIDANTIEVYCYYNAQTYTLYRNI